MFVADAYARRILARHRLSARRHEFTSRRAPSWKRICRPIRRCSTSCTPLIVAAGQEYCRTLPLCGACPLRGVSTAAPLGAYDLVEQIGDARLRIRIATVRARSAIP